MNKIILWPKPPVEEVLPMLIMRPCDAGLILASGALETQLGTVEAYNRIARCAETLRSKIDRGDAQPQNPLYASSIRGE